MARIYEKKNVTYCDYDSVSKTIYVYWNSLYKDDIIRECVEVQMKKVEAGALSIIIDVKEAAGTPSDDTQRWFAKEVFPFYDQHGLKQLITILPKSAVAKVGASGWNKTASSFKFDIYETDSIENAKKLTRSTARAA